MRTALSRLFRSSGTTGDNRTANRLGRLESLETRLTPATYTWDGGGVTPVFEDENNWSSNTTPGPGDTAVIGSAYALDTILISSALTIKNLDSRATLQVITSGAPFEVTELAKVDHLRVTGSGATSLFKTKDLISKNSEALLDGVLIVMKTGTVTDLSIIHGGVVTGPGDVTVTGKFTAGEVYDSARLDPGGKLIIAPGASAIINGGALYLSRVLDNYGAFTITAPSGGYSSYLGFGLLGAGPNVLNNLAGASLTVDCNATFGGYVGAPNAFNNAGAFTTGPLTTTLSNIPFSNTGTTIVSAGTLMTDSTIASSGTVTIAAGATLTTSTSDYVQSAGTTTVNGILDPAGIIDIKGGTVRGAGTLMSNTTNAGTVSPGMSPGKLTVSGDYSQTGTLAIELNGITPGSLYDQLAVSGAVTLGGSLAATLGYTPAAGDSFVIVDHGPFGGPVSGTFAGLPEGAVTTIGGKSFAISYKGGTGNDVTLTHVAIPPIKVSSVVINGGDAQRSRVLSVAMTFDQHLTLSFSLADAFAVTRQGDGKQPNLVTTVDDSGATTVVTLTFIGSNAVEYGSLADGRYTLSIDATKVSNANGLLDGDGNGVGGDNYTLVGSPAESHHLFRLFGDSDGDGTVAANDFIAFRLALGGSSATFDFDGDGAVAASDFIQFRLRFGGSI